MPRMTRRDLVKAATAPLLIGSLAARAARPERAPNVVFIMADDLGYADVSCYGSRGPRTPSIDSLAAAGMKFLSSYANSCVCSATRLALMTGRYQHRLRAGLEEPLTGADPSIGLSIDQPTLPGLLVRQGYSTSLVGKWHLGNPPLFGPLKSGYQRFYGIYAGAVDYFTHRFDQSDTTSVTNGLSDGERALKETGYLTDVLGDAAVSEIRELAPRRQPFMLSLHFTAPHWPWEGPGDASIAGPPSSLMHGDGGNLATYWRMIQSLDENVGKVLRVLDEQGVAEDTIVIFTSDNGGERFSDVWPLIGRKGELLEGGIRVPLLVRWPRAVLPGAVTRQVAITMDWLPTLLEASSGRPDANFPSDGLSLLPALRGAPASSRTLYWRHRSNAQRAMLDGSWKYLSLGGKEYLFDLATDEREQANLRTREAARFAAMKADYSRWEATMLPYPERTYSEDVTRLATDRY